MRRLFILTTGLVVALTTLPAVARKNASRSETPAKLELIILEAPGPVGCYTDVRPMRLTDCEEREAAVDAFKKLNKIDEKRATAVVVKRFEEIPSPKGGYLPILLSVVSGDKGYIPYLKKVYDANPKSELGQMAKVAAIRINTGKCSKQTPRRFAELCMPTL